MKSFLKNNFPIILILTVAILLRFFKLANNPIGFNDDEAAFGYNAYSIVKTLKDEWGRFLPFPAFESFGDWKLVFYLYATAASQLIFGVTEFATRLPSAMFGVLSVFSTYLLGAKIFEKKVGIIAALFLAISPWHIIASRNAFESDVLIFFITIATYFFLKGLENKKNYIFAIFSFGICFYIYRSAWLFVPFFSASLLILFYKEIKIQKLAIFKYGLFAAAFVVPMTSTVFSSSGQARFQQESFVSGVANLGIINEINEKRGECYKNTSEPICNLLYNRATSYASTYTNNYFENLSPGTYFTKGVAGGYQSFSNRGLFYSFELPLMLLGIVGILLSRNRKAYILIAWILLAPIGASFTGVGNPGRLNIIMPSVQILAAAGVVFAAANLKTFFIPKLFYGTLFVLVSFSLVRLISDMFFYYPQVSGRFQRYGYRELVHYLKSEQDNYSQVAISRKGDDAKQYIHYLFFNGIDPNEFQSALHTHKFEGDDGWVVVRNIGNVYFYPSAPALEDMPEKSLIAISPKEANFPSEPVRVFNFPNGDRFFEIYELEKDKQI